MNKLVSVAFHEHPILGNLAIDFCDQSNHPVDTVLIAGENGTGKSTLLNCLYKIASGTVDFEATIKLKCNGIINTLEYYSTIINGAKHIFVKDSKGLDTISGSNSFFTKYPICGIFSDIDINFHSKAISSVTSLILDSNNKSRRSDTDLPTQIKQLLIDIQALDDGDLASAYRKARECKLSFDNLNVEERIPRFTKAFNLMFNDLTYSHVENTGRSKSILFNKYGKTVDLDALSSGEKQIVYRGCFLLKDINALNNAFVFIDEPEISLHPSWQIKVMDYYKSIFTNSEDIQTSQIFTVTHSPFIIHNEHRKKDKVVVLFRNTDGTICVEDKPEYYKCTSTEVVQDAFVISNFSKEKSCVYLEGRTDEKYFKKAAEVFNYSLPFDFKWVGYIDERGQEVNTGDKSVDKAFQFLVAQNLSIKNICLKDCDTGREPVIKNNVIAYSIPKYDNSKNINKGIENALVLDNVDLTSFYTRKTTTGDYGEQKTFQEFDKMACCDSICSMNAEELSTIFSNLKDVLDKLLTFYNTQ